MRAWLGFLGLIVLGVASCSSDTEPQHECTEIGCTDGVHVGVLLAELVDGEYTLQVTLDGDAYECTLLVPDGLPAQGMGHALNCSQELQQALVISRSSCQGSDCPPNGPVELSFTPVGFPESIALRLERDGELVAEDQAGIEYSQIYPNGPECDGGCRAAGVEFIFD